MSALLEVEGLTKHFPVRRGLLGRSTGLVRAVDSISFTIEAGTTFGLVGESGCGKTTTSKLVLGLERPTAGAIRFQDEDVLTLDRAGLRRYRRSIQAVFQDPYASLDPRMRVGSIVAEPLVINEPMDRAARGRRVLELLDLVGLPARAAELFPHEFSGGQRQRVAIARALALSPRLVVLDEPVSALDVSIRAQILNLLRDLQKRLGASGRLTAIEGQPPDPVSLGPGCAFAPRCTHVMERCRVEAPPDIPIDATHATRCWLHVP